MDMSPAIARTLVEVQDLVDELRTLARELPEDIWCLYYKRHDKGTYEPDRERSLPRRLYPRMRTLLSRQGLEELPSGSRQEARMKILEAMGLCLQKARCITFIDTRLVGDSDLSFSELEALYRRQPESSTALKELEIAIPANACEYWGPGSWRLLIDLLGTPSLGKVILLDLPLSELSQLAKAVASSGRASFPFRRVHVCHGYKNLYRFQGATASLLDLWAGNVTNFLKLMVAPNLEELSISLGRFADEDVGELIGAAFASVNGNTSLRLTIVQSGGDSPFTEQKYRQVVAEGGEAGETIVQDDDADACTSDGPGTSVATVSAGKHRMGSLGRLLSAVFLRSSRNTTISSLQVILSEKTSLKADLEVLSQVPQMDNHVTEFQLGALYMYNVESRHLRGFFKSLQLNSVHVQSLVLKRVEFDADSFAMFADMLKSCSMHGLKHLTLYCVGGEVDYLDWPGVFTSLSQMESVSLSGDDEHTVDQQQARELCQWIQGSKALRTLQLEGSWSQVNWRQIFACLRENQSLECLSIDGSLEDEDSYRELMEMLQINSTLQQIEFTGEDGPRQAAVREALKCKARQESYLAELRRGLGQGRAKWERPMCGRLFLCGSPEAGKTRLTRTMLKVAKKKSLLKRLKEKLLRRTEGVEIHTLTNDENPENVMQIRVWDLAGQEMFRALQQFLFPRLSRACLFIFVFSPYAGGKKLKPRLEEAFENELREWLRFIASNSAVTGFTRPQVMVVISHEDMYKSSGIDLKWRDTVLARFTSDFEGVIGIHRTSYFIDGHESQHVKPIVDVVFSIFHQLFREKLFQVPTACTDMSQHLVEWALQHPEEPIIDDRTFFSLCRNIPDLRTFSEKGHEDNNERLLNAVGSYLHDVGTVINMGSEENLVVKQEKAKASLMVVNPNWLTHVFLGRFICLIHEFQLAPEEVVEWVESVDGFLSGTQFQQLLSKRFLEPMKKEFPKLSVDNLRELMENLDFLYVTEAVNQDCLFFIPTLFKDRSKRTLQWLQKTLPIGTLEVCFVGVRLCCKDSKRTYLSHAFFSRFQVMIWRKLMEESQPNTPLIECRFNLISILMDGIDILIENDEDGDFVDVLIRSTKSRQTTWDYVENDIVHELRDFCASSKGCPGVELVMNIIRTECVERLTLCKHRKSQSVSREELKKKLMATVQKLSPGSDENDLFSHTWMRVPETDLGAACERAIELLPPKDVADVKAWIRARTQALGAKVTRLDDVMNGVDIDSQEIRLGTRGGQTSNLLEHLEKKVARSRSEQWVDPNVQRVENLIRGCHQDIKGDLRRVGEGVKEVLVEVRNLKLEVQAMNRLQRKEEENLTRIHHKLDKLMGHSVSTTAWPKRPYFTRKDASVRHKITAAVNIGKHLMLHFECEEINGHHIVINQPGYEIIVERENCEALRQISTNSVRVMRYLLKAGLHISIGVGDLVPELEISDGNSTSLTSSSIVRLLEKVQVQDGHSSKQPTDPCSPEEAWKYLQGFVESKLKSRITDYFLLHPAVYSDKDSTHAWLCQSCLEVGLAARKLTLREL